MLGLRLRDLVSGNMRWVFISNYMVDLDWLLAAAPDLALADRLMIAHGWRRPVRCVACAFATDLTQATLTLLSWTVQCSKIPTPS